MKREFYYKTKTTIIIDNPDYLNKKKTHPNIANKKYSLALLTKDIPSFCRASNLGKLITMANKLQRLLDRLEIDRDMLAVYHKKSVIIPVLLTIGCPAYIARGYEIKRSNIKGESK